MRFLILIVWSVALVHVQADEPVPDLPNPVGVAGPFAGVSNGVLIIAGGANFPEKKPWEGGKKVWHETVYAFNGEWKIVGKLPSPLAYGISITDETGLIAIGGSNAEKHFSTVFRLEWKANQLQFIELPSLPQTLANGSGVRLGDSIYVVGGQERPDSKIASKTVYRFDLRQPKGKWETLNTFPGVGRIFPVLAEVKGKLYVVSGAELKTDREGAVRRNYLRDAYVFDPESAKWQKLPDVPTPVVAAPSPAPSDLGGFNILGGDDGTQIASLPDQHRGFSKQILRFDIEKQRWEMNGELPLSQVTAPVVPWKKGWLIPSGEIRPGIRTPKISFFPSRK